jgi:hypothetical protein
MPGNPWPTVTRGEVVVEAGDPPAAGFNPNVVWLVVTFAGTENPGDGAGCPPCRFCGATF